MRTGRYLFSVLAFLIMSLPCNADTVRLGLYESNGMFIGANPGDVKSGYCYEYLMHIANYTGWNYEFCHGSFSELLEKLEKGEIDILPYTNYNDERAAKILFSKDVLAEEEYYIVMKDYPDNGIDALNGAVLATITGADFNTMLMDFITANRLDVKFKYYTEIDDIWKALKNNEVSAAISTSISYKKGDWKYICSFGKKPTYIGVTKNRPDLLEKLDEATYMIDMETPAFLHNLYEKYFSDNPVLRTLTPEEQEWIVRHPVLHVGGFTNDAPYIYSYNENTGTATGLTVDVINGIIERLGLGIMADFKCYESLEQLEKALDNGELDVIIPFYPDYNVAHDHNLITSNIVRTSNMELVYKNGISYSQAIRTIATPDTRLGIYYVNDNFPGSEVIGAYSIQDAVNLVLEGKATGAIAQNIVLHSIKEQHDNLNYIILSKGCGTCFAARPENYPLIRILNHGLKYFSESEISAIAAKNSLESNVSVRAFLSLHRNAFISIILVLLSIMVIGLMLMHYLKKKADAANKSKTDFLFNMSHDIRTPMNAISGFTIMAKQHVDDKDKVLDYLDKIDISGQQLLALINQVLEMARIESGKIELHEHPINVTERYNDLIAILSEQAQIKGLEFNHTLLGIKHNYVYADETRMAQITMNIAGNAMKYTLEGGKIDYSLAEIKARKDGYATFLFTVTDTGIGMSENFIKDLFKPFARENSTTVSQIQGTGLGLPIVKRLVDIAGGLIEVHSEKGKGTKFEITMDFRICDKKVEKMQAEIEMPIQEPAASDFKGKRVLLVEDNELNREIARYILEEKGLEVDEATDGDVAVEMVMTAINYESPTYYDCIFMDIQMPHMNGYTATAKIREIYDFEGFRIPIIALSANAFEEDRQKSRDAGMDDHIAKPIDINELTRVLNKFLK